MSSESTAQHREEAEIHAAVPCAVVTVSDTRTPDTDTSGALMRTALESAGHSVVFYRIVRDEPDQIASLLETIVDTTEARAILFNGGTGIARRDTTFDALSSRLEKTLPGFGELFRMLSWDQVGAAAMLSRATAGLYRGRLVFSTPGSRNAVELAMEKLIIPELPHLVWESLR